MCMKGTCSTCHKSSWWGCGSHIPQVMDQIPAESWCECEPKVEKKYPPMAGKAD